MRLLAKIGEARYHGFSGKGTMGKRPLKQVCWQARCGRIERDKCLHTMSRVSGRNLLGLDGVLHVYLGSGKEAERLNLGGWQQPDQSEPPFFK